MCNSTTGKKEEEDEDDARICNITSTAKNTNQSSIYKL